MKKAWLKQYLLNSTYSLIFLTLSFFNHRAICFPDFHKIKKQKTNDSFFPFHCLFCMQMTIQLSFKTGSKISVENELINVLPICELFFHYFCKKVIFRAIHK